MKQSFLILILCLFSSIVVHADDYYTPQWGEFLPPQYLNTPYKQGATPSNILDYTRLIFYKNKPDNNNYYWANRITDFEKELDSCNRIDDKEGKILCYMKLRLDETEKTHQKMVNDLEDQIDFYRRSYHSRKN